MTLRCPKCGTALNVPQARPGSPVTCTACGNVTTVPSKTRIWPWVLLGIGVLGCLPCIGIMAAIAIPNFILFQARAKQGECKSNLRAAFTAQRSFMMEKDTYSERVEDVGFAPERGNRYAYAFARQGALADRSQATASADQGAIGVMNDMFRYPQARALGLEDFPATFTGGVTLGLSGSCPDDCHITMACVGNVDSDETLDVWSVSSRERTAENGETIPPGQPYNDVSDIEN